MNTSPIQRCNCPTAALTLLLPLSCDMKSESEAVVVQKKKISLYYSIKVHCADGIGIEYYFLFDHSDVLYRGRTALFSRFTLSSGHTMTLVLTTADSIITSNVDISSFFFKSSSSNINIALNWTPTR